MIERNHCPLDLLITDMLMPRMGGQEVAEKLLAIHPKLRVLYMSGDKDKIVVPQGGEMQAAVLQKPFRLNRLSEKIHDLLSDSLLDSLRQTANGAQAEAL
jgi:DNA-binding NtrC family response regulator